ncbi:hypothetical protein ACFV0T_25100 [Streptomyces sp. NPDC059582]|uniref:hypothetical protein n=1 Tax=Streptomyces sp. NPDC059582 TaxID=3346875 RepID=UPI0036C5F8ED
MPEFAAQRVISRHVRFSSVTAAAASRSGRGPRHRPARRPPGRRGAETRPAPERHTPILSRTLHKRRTDGVTDRTVLPAENRSRIPAVGLVPLMLVWLNAMTTTRHLGAKPDSRQRRVT